MLSLVLSYFWLTFVLRRFPYTRPWGESLREFLLTRLATMGLAIVGSIPDLFTVAVIVVITRFAVRFACALFDAAEQERLTLPGVYPETAPADTPAGDGAALAVRAGLCPTRICRAADSDAFKGVSVFVGLIVSLGSSGIVGQTMSGMTITYSRAVRLGDFVRIGDVEGTVTHLGSLSTKIKTERREDVTIPNAVVVSTPITNYSRFAEIEGVSAPVTVTIGYDVPWRQIHAMLLLAAERTSNIKRSPAPVVRQREFREFSRRSTRCWSASSIRRLRAATLGSTARQYSGCLQRIRRADHDAQLRRRSHCAKGRASREVVRRAGVASPRREPRRRNSAETR